MFLNQLVGQVVTRKIPLLVNSPVKFLPMNFPSQKSSPVSSYPSESPQYFFKYQTKYTQTVLSYFKQIKSKGWLHGRTSVKRERNNRHVFVPVLHDKGISRLKVQICWLSFLLMEIILEILHFKSVISPLVDPLESLVYKQKRQVFRN